MAKWLIPFVLTAVGAVFAPLASKIAARTAGPLHASVIESATTFAAVALLGEALAPRQWLGVGVIIAGIWMVLAPA